MQMKIAKVYKPFLDSKNRYAILYGGAGSGKSVVAAQKILIRLMSEESQFHRNNSCIEIIVSKKSVRYSFIFHRNNSCIEISISYIFRQIFIKFHRNNSCIEIDLKYI